MDYAAILDVFTRYGAIAIFVLVFLEYMNLPGFPAGIIMPLAGIMAAGGNISFPWVMVITVAAGLLGSLVLYVLGFTGGRFFLEKYMNKFPKQRPRIEKYLAWVQEKG
ncbi:MAG: DedA family protein, partial [Acetatifactor sp.]|nr:DedA family protein [Acetatifactor sp.]